MTVAFQFGAAALMAQNSHLVSSAGLDLAGVIVNNGTSKMQGLVSPLSNDRMSLIELLSELEKRFGTSFSFDHEMLEGKFVDRKYADEFISSVSANGMTRFEKGLADLLGSFEMLFRKFENGSYVIYPNRDKAPVRSEARSSDQASASTIHRVFPDQVEQEVVVKGQVRTSETGDPMPGVNILVKGTVNGTVTDFGGRYAISVSGSDAVLVFSFIGYASQEGAVSGRERTDV